MLLYEDVYGKYGIVYHRTGRYIKYPYTFKPPGSVKIEDILNDKEVENFIKNFSVDGFKASSGMYGTGLYSTYSLGTQLETGRMEGYGPLIIAYGVKMYRTVILDKDQAEKVYGANHVNLFDQLALFGVSKEIMVVDKKFMELARIHEIGDYSQYGGLTSTVADRLNSSDLFQSFIQKGIVKGLIFSGNHDGKVMVIYAPEIAKPLKYTFYDERIFNQFEIPYKKKDPLWKKIDETEYTKQVRTNIINLELKSDFDKHYKEYLNKYGEKQVKMASLFFNADYRTMTKLLQTKVLQPNSFFFDKFLIFHLIDLDNDKVIEIYEKLGGGPFYKFQDKYDPLMYAIVNNKAEAVKGLASFKFLSFTKPRPINTFSQSVAIMIGKDFADPIPKAGVTPIQVAKALNYHSCKIELEDIIKAGHT